MWRQGNRVISVNKNVNNKKVSKNSRSWVDTPKNSLISLIHFLGGFILSFAGKIPANPSSLILIIFFFFFWLQHWSCLLVNDIRLGQISWHRNLSFIQYTASTHKPCNMIWRRPQDYHSLVTLQPYNLDSLSKPFEMNQDVPRCECTLRLLNVWLCTQLCLQIFVTPWTVAY